MKFDALFYLVARVMLAVIMLTGLALMMWGVILLSTGNLPNPCSPRYGVTVFEDGSIAWDDPVAGTGSLCIPGYPCDGD